MISYIYVTNSPIVFRAMIIQKGSFIVLCSSFTWQMVHVKYSWSEIVIALFMTAGPKPEFLQGGGKCVSFHYPPPPHFFQLQTYRRAKLTLPKKNIMHLFFKNYFKFINQIRGSGLPLLTIQNSIRECTMVIMQYIYRDLFFF